MNKIKHILHCCHEVNLAILSIFHWFSFKGVWEWFRRYGPVLAFIALWLAYCLVGLYAGMVTWNYFNPNGDSQVYGGLVGLLVFYVIAMYLHLVREQCKKVEEHD